VARTAAIVAGTVVAVVGITAIAVGKAAVGGINIVVGMGATTGKAAVGNIITVGKAAAVDSTIMVEIAVGDSPPDLFRMD